MNFRRQAGETYTSATRTGPSMSGRTTSDSALAGGDAEVAMPTAMAGSKLSPAAVKARVAVRS